MSRLLLLLLPWVRSERLSSPIERPRSITACLVQPSLPAAMFREESAYGYGSGRVVWHVLETIPEADGSWIHDGEVVCDAVFWQDEDWSSTFHQYREMASLRITTRVVAGWVSEACIRTDDILDTYEFVWYPALHDDRTHLVALPLGPSTAFPYIHTVEDDDDDDDDDTFQYLVNYLASLETSDLRLTWFNQAKDLSERLLAETPYCAFVRSHNKWQEPVSYAKEDQEETSPMNCTCETMATCNDATKFMGSLTSSEYASVLNGSAFTLSPPGHNFQCFRHYEAAAVSSIPVMVDPEAAPDECSRSARYFFRHRKTPFIFAGTPSEAFEVMMKLAVDPTELARRRREVRKWYDDEMSKGVRRVEAAVTAAAAVADARYGKATLGTTSGHAPRGTLPGKFDVKTKQNVVALTLDPTLTKELLVWLNDVHGVPAIHNFLEYLIEDGAITVGWTYAGAGDNSIFSEKLLKVLSPPATTIYMAPIVLFARDPLEYIPDLAMRIDRQSPEDHDLLAFITDRYGGGSQSSIWRATQYWLQWTRRAFALSSFDVQIEAFDPITALKALGLRRHPNMMDADQKPFTLQHRPLRWTWPQLADKIGELVDDVYKLATDLGYTRMSKATTGDHHHKRSLRFQ